MNAQLTLLLEIQDLHLQRTALLEEPGYDRVQEQHFKLDPQAAIEALDRKIGELREKLEPAIQQRCERGLPALGRMVVPVIDGVCYGCFVSIPTSRAVNSGQTLETCESCGRFIYVLP
jgi:predicted  nucleic acid-binding Zn-ribbon protein